MFICFLAQLMNQNNKKIFQLQLNQFQLLVILSNLFKYCFRMLKIIRQKDKNQEKKKTLNKEIAHLKHRNITFFKPFARIETRQILPKIQRRSFSKIHRSKQLNSMTHYGSDCFSIPRFRQLSSGKKRLTSAKLIETQTQNFYPHSNMNTYKIENKLQNKIQNRKHTKTFIGSRLKNKLKQYFLFLDLVNVSQRILYKGLQNRKYKVFIGKGNNSKLVRRVFQNRFWWTIASKIDEEGVNLVWTQWSKSSIFSQIPQHQQRNPQMKMSQSRSTNKRYFQKKKKYQLQKFESLVSMKQCSNGRIRKDKRSLEKKSSNKTTQQEISIREFTKSTTFLKSTITRKQISITHNHIQNHDQLSNKKSLFLNLKKYCQEKNMDIFRIVPFTFHIEGEQNQLQKVKKQQDSMIQKRQKFLWIVKPGQNSNRGCGIQVFKKVQCIKTWIQNQKEKHQERTFIIQKYIFPFLYHRRKFDIRCFVVVIANPKVSAYFYRDGYLRTASKQFSTKNFGDKFIHLTNDAIQKKCPGYGKYQKGNKVSYSDFQKYLDLFEAEKKLNFFSDVLPIMKEIVYTSIKSAYRLNSNQRNHTFQIFGYDFMIDSNFKPWLIQINTNPCLETPCELLKQLIPCMVENAAKIAVDSVYRPPKLDSWPQQNLFTCPEKLIQENNFQLIYNQVNHQL